MILATSFNTFYRQSAGFPLRVRRKVRSDSVPQWKSRTPEDFSRCSSRDQSAGIAAIARGGGGLLLAILGLLGIMGSGCSLLFPEPLTKREVNSPLKPLVAPREAIALEVYFVDRRIGDPLVGDSLWESLHSVSSMDPETRKRLQRDGFRVAMSSSRPPRPLQVLMALSDGNDPTRRAVVQPYMIPSGQETWIVSRSIEDGTLIRRQPLDGREQTFEIQGGQALFKVQASHVEDGWARLVIIPEIQHGQDTLKPTANETEWTLRNRRQAVTLYEDRLSAELNLGEILVIGMHDHADGKIAGQFFQGESSQGLRRLMLIRVADMRTIEPQRITSTAR